MFKRKNWPTLMRSQGSSFTYLQPICPHRPQKILCTLFFMICSVFCKCIVKIKDIFYESKSKCSKTFRDYFQKFIFLQSGLEHTGIYLMLKPNPFCFLCTDPCVRECGSKIKSLSLIPLCVCVCIGWQITGISVLRHLL